MRQPVVFDIDGTLTDEHYTEGNLLTVRPNFVILDIAHSLQETYPLVISTARPEKFREKTLQWLSDRELYPKEVYMREEGRNTAADHMIKFGHLQSIEKKFGKPHLWVDDNPDNIRMLLRNEVPVLQVKWIKNLKA